MMMDAVPGRVNSMWYIPDQSGEFLIQCREYCGFSHYQMRAKLFVEEPSGGEQGAQVTNASTTDLIPSIGAGAVAS
jgi:cytochrome c oxidase subunit 2